MDVPAAALSEGDKTAPFELGSGNRVCLLLHGFATSPWDVRPLGDALAARGLRVRAILLPGHATTPEAMERVTFHDWVRATEEALAELSGQGRVFVAGHSMGALLALLAAARSPERVQALALMAPPVRFVRPHLRALAALRRLGALRLLPRWMARASPRIEDPASRAEAPTLPAWPSARLGDLFEVQARALEAAPRVRAPALVLMAKKDPVASLAGGRKLLQRMTGSGARMVLLDEGLHTLARDLARTRVAEAIGDFFDQHAG